MSYIIPQRFSYISTEVLDCTGVSVSQKQIDPHTVFLGDVKFHVIIIKTRALQPHQILYDWAKGRDEVKIRQVLQENFG